MRAGAALSRWSKIVRSSTVGSRHVELGLDLRQGGLRHIGQLVEHGDQVAVLDDLDARDGFGGGGVDALQFRAVGRRPQDLRVEHAGQADVARVLGLAGDFFPAIPAQQRLPEILNSETSLRDGLAVRWRSIFCPFANWP